MTKRVVLVRHGVSEMNVALRERPWGSRDFKDPEIWDAPLTSRGFLEACQTRAPEVELVVSSPLTRALQTATGVFGEARLGPARALALPLASERLYLSSDVGTPRSRLRARWGHLFAMDHLDAERWWFDGDTEEWRPPGTYVCPGEPAPLFLDRLRRLLAWIDERPETSLALVCHWGVLHALTGDDFANCEVRTLDFDDLALREPPY